MLRLLKSAVLIWVVSGIAGWANAQSLTGNVGSADIGKGDRSAEFRLGADEEGLVRGRAHYEQGLSDWYQVRAIAAFRKRDGESWDYTGLTLENWLQWASEGDSGEGFNAGLRLAYTLADGQGPDEAAIRLTLTDRFAGNWEWRANLIAAQETGDQRAEGAELESRFQITRAAPFALAGSGRWRLGAELFSEFGNTQDLPELEQQAHQLGPVLKGKWSNGAFVQIGVRAGLTPGSDDFMTKAFIGREF